MGLGLGLEVVGAREHDDELALPLCERAERHAWLGLGSGLGLGLESGSVVSGKGQSRSQGQGCVGEQSGAPLVARV